MKPPVCQTCNHVTALGYTCNRKGIPDTEESCDEYVKRERMETFCWADLIIPYTGSHKFKSYGT